MSFFYSCRAMFQALLTVSLGLTGAQALSQQDTAFPQTMNEGVIHDTARMGNREALERLLHATPSLRDARTPLGALPRRSCVTATSTRAELMPEAIGLPSR